MCTRLLCKQLPLCSRSLEVKEIQEGEMMSQVLLKVDVKKLKKKFLELLNSIEQNKVQLIGEFLEEEVIGNGLSIEEFADVIKDIPGYSLRQLKRYRQLYKAEGSALPEEFGFSKAVILTSIKDAEAKEKFIEIAKEVSSKQLQSLVND
jgi:hypothetical protein